MNTQGRADTARTQFCIVLYLSFYPFVACHVVNVVRTGAYDARLVSSCKRMHANMHDAMLRARLWLRARCVCVLAAEVAHACAKKTCHKCCSALFTGVRMQHSATRDRRNISNTHGGLRASAVTRRRHRAACFCSGVLIEILVSHVLFSCVRARVRRRRRRRRRRRCPVRSTDG